MQPLKRVLPCRFEPVGRPKVCDHIHTNVHASTQPQDRLCRHGPAWFSSLRPLVRPI